MLHKLHAVLHLVPQPSPHGNRNRLRKQRSVSLLILLYCAFLAAALRAQERPYFVTYSHDLEEPGNLELTSLNIAGAPRGANAFLSSTLELEYGATGWWTMELYLSGQSTQDQSTVYNGFRFENRFRPLLREHWINPVLYLEFEDINAADKSLLEVVGHDGIQDFRAPNALTQAEKQRELEMKLILSRNWRNWNFSQNSIVEKNLAQPPWEFGYALAASRPIGLMAHPTPCRFCAENFAAGLEMYGGLGDQDSLGLAHTSHYISPTGQWSIPNGPTFLIGPAFGLNSQSAGALLRFAVSYEVPQALSHLLAGRTSRNNGAAQ